MLLGVDVGGTFTDAVLFDGADLHAAKAPTTPGDESRGVLEAVARVLEAAGAAPGDVTRFAHGMTVATNALLEGRGARAALVTTEGFEDVVELGRQNRPELYRLQVGRPAPLVPPERRFGAPERMTPEGVLRPLSPEAARAVAERVAGCGAEAVAVVLLHSYRHPEHEQALREALAGVAAGISVHLSSEAVGTFREYERAATTEIDAALSPLLRAYLERLVARAGEQGLPEPSIMQSNGGLTDAAAAGAHAARTVLSGPAGGAAAAAFLARRAGAERVLCFDMGGTSCDICVVDGGEVQERGEGEIAGRPIALPMLAIHTVGAGGGSIAWRDAGGALRVGPRSAGARPGPACYGRGGEEPTVTDANLLLGHLDPDAPLAGGLRLDRAAAERAVSRLATSLGLELEACARGIVAVANAEMVRALRVVTVERGIDPREYALMCFGGAGPLHAAAVADALGIEEVLCPRSSGVLAALGLVVGARRRDVQRSLFLRGGALTAERLAGEAADLARAARDALGEAGDGVKLRATYELRYRGQASELAVPGPLEPDPAALRREFEARHEARYGHHDPEGELELVTLRVTASVAGPELPRRRGGPKAPPRGLSSTTARIELPGSTLLVPAGWRAEEDPDGELIRLRPDAQDGAGGGSGGSRPSRGNPSSSASASVGRGGDGDPVELQLLAGGLRAIAEEMGAVLIGSAHSANIKERRDASTALFDAAGEMVMQAEHIPVHLGAMPAAVAAVRELEQAPERAWILNDPYRGGTHLPDITVILPVYDAAGLLGFAAARAHHADVGGPTPGSMPADSRTLADEGVVIEPRVLDETAVSELVAQMRRPDQRRADLRAQLAACRIGALRLRELSDRRGPERLRRGFAEVLDYAERRTRACLERLGHEPRHARDVLEAREGDLELRLAAQLTGDDLILDFAGSVGQHEGNLNCPLAVTRSACYFAMRVLTDPDVPACAGAYRPIDVRVPEGTLLNARSPAAVVGGNVETSSRVADLVLAAFGQALGQGTMNNLTLGDEEHVYYETIGGGQAAGAGADGPSGVHVAMSNTLNTPVEALELEFPLRVTRYSLRRGSGGAGTHRGGDGVIRELEALSPLHASLITERRRHAPRGAQGGRPGARGRNWLDERELPPKWSGRVGTGQRLRVETPGGGGYGEAGS